MERKLHGKEVLTMAAVGFEPTPPKRLEPKSSALDRSATLPHRVGCYVAEEWLKQDDGDL